MLLYRVHGQSASRTCGFAKPGANLDELRRQMLDDVKSSNGTNAGPLRVGLLWYAVNLGGADQLPLNLLANQCEDIRWSGLALMDPEACDESMLRDAANYTYVACGPSVSARPVTSFPRANDAARFVARNSDVLVTWGVDRIDEVLGPFHGKLILMSHCSDWLPIDRVKSTQPYDTSFAAVSEAAAVPFQRVGVTPDRIHVIRNGSAVTRRKPLLAREEIRHTVGHCSR